MISNFIGFTINPDDKLSETDKQIQLALGFGLGKRAFYGEENQNQETEYVFRIHRLYG